MKVHAMGMGYRHTADFIADRPNGVGDNLLLIFKTPAIVKLNGNIIHVPVDSAIFYPVDTPHLYGADNSEYINHWMHFETDDISFMRKIGLPLNSIINIRDIASVEHYFELIELEYVSENRNSDESCNLLIRLMLTKLAESADAPAETGSQYGARLRELRAAIRRNPTEKHSIPELAKTLSLSPSHFQYLYKKEFGVSCHEDVIAARIDMAEYYLKNTGLTLRQVSELCGYENDVHFIRQFKKRRGMTATEYREQNAQ